MTRRNRHYPPELRERAVRMVFEVTPNYDSEKALRPTVAPGERPVQPNVWVGSRPCLLPPVARRIHTALPPSARSRWR
jgi:hypothetical protein